ncbi:MAG: SDR family oxidoreductase [Burkholderiaceae bacterium]|nr:SDR family oxidoreductase [Burkholderiaceae bacterium]
MLLKDKNAIIYGAGGAIGGAVARAFAREGAKVFLAGDTRPPIDALAKEIMEAGGLAEVAEVDALDAQAVEKHASAVIEKAGSIDVSFNLIAVPHVHGKPYVDLTLEEFAQPIGAFATTHFLTATAGARHMVSAGSGVILMMTTPAGRMASTFSGAFAPVCALIESFAKGLAAEVGPHGVRVVCLRSSGSPEAPGVREAMKSHAKAEGKPLEQFQEELAKGALLGRLTMLTEVADVAAFLASDRASAMTGTSANVSCGIGVD